MDKHKEQVALEMRVYGLSTFFTCQTPSRYAQAFSQKSATEARVVDKRVLEFPLRRKSNYSISNAKNLNLAWRFRFEHQNCACCCL